MHEKLDRSG